jgi:hypothetical protein
LIDATTNGIHENNNDDANNNNNNNNNNDANVYNRINSQIERILIKNNLHNEE